ncbi:MAG: hypothetical protein ACRDS9_06940 [Pseudonocardiaceae bacterium]
MGNGGFSVVGQALANAADGVSRLMAALDEHDVDDIDCDKAAVGHDALAATLEDFCDRWQRGVDHLAEDGKELANRLVGTANAYFGVDQSTGNAFLDVVSQMQGKLKDWSWTV